VYLRPQNGGLSQRWSLSGVFSNGNQRRFFVYNMGAKNNLDAIAYIPTGEPIKCGKLLDWTARLVLSMLAHVRQPSKMWQPAMYWTQPLVDQSLLTPITEMWANGGRLHAIEHDDKKKNPLYIDGVLTPSRGGRSAVLSCPFALSYSKRSVNWEIWKSKYKSEFNLEKYNISYLEKIKDEGPFCLTPSHASYECNHG